MDRLGQKNLNLQLGCYICDIQTQGNFRMNVLMKREHMTLFNNSMSARNDIQMGAILKVITRPANDISVQELMNKILLLIFISTTKVNW